ncbi:MAG: hypothetical protein AB8G16_03490 [Gammaproteobacteria bacterium]
MTTPNSPDQPRTRPGPPDIEQRRNEDSSEPRSDNQPEDQDNAVRPTTRPGPPDIEE